MTTVRFPSSIYSVLHNEFLLLWSLGPLWKAYPTPGSLPGVYWKQWCQLLLESVPYGVGAIVFVCWGPSFRSLALERSRYETWGSGWQIMLSNTVRIDRSTILRRVGFMAVVWGFGPCPPWGLEHSKSSEAWKASLGPPTLLGTALCLFK